jgi:transposase-like protein
MCCGKCDTTKRQASVLRALNQLEGVEAARELVIPQAIDGTNKLHVAKNAASKGHHQHKHKKLRDIESLMDAHSDDEH